MTNGVNGLWDRLLGADSAGAPDAAFLLQPDGGVRRRGDTATRALRVAGALAALGVRPGDRVAMQVQKSPEALELYLGCVAAGAVFLPLNTAYTPAEIAYFVGDAEPALLVVDPSAAASLAEALPSSGVRLATLDASGAGSFSDAVSAATPQAPAPRGPDDLAAILYTSGTTGRSKGAMLSQRNLLSNAETLASAWAFTPEDVLLHALPIFHTHGLFVACNVTLVAGGSMIFLPKFDVDTVLAQLPNATAMMGVPTFYTRLLSDARFDRSAAAHMRLFVSGSAPLLAETHVGFEERTGHRILERYGMTETNMICSNPYAGARKAGTVGPPLPGVSVRVVAQEGGSALPAGEIGEIEVTGPNVFQGYWRMPEKTAEEFRPDGYFQTGDLGRIDEEGYLTIVGRAKDLVISGGLNVYPKEVESAIDDLDGVEESAVIGVPHPDFGEAVVAVVARRDGASAPDEAAVIEGVRDRLAAFKRPKRVFFVDHLPRNTMGKVQKKALREAHAALFA